MKWLDFCGVRLMFIGLIVAIVINSIELANGATITVGPDVGHDFDVIQAGIDTAIDGDIVLIAPGEYIITEPITFRGKAITVKSEDGPDETTIRMSTPVDPNRGSVVLFENKETAESILDGFTITGGRGCPFWLPYDLIFVWVGGGIYFNASSGTIRNCRIFQNNANGGGGVCCLESASMTITDCTIAANSAALAGGGVFCGGENLSSITMIHCVIVGNTAGLGGGGLETWCQASAIVINCVIAQNTVVNGGGGGIICAPYGHPNCSAVVTNSIFWENTATEGRDIWVRSGASLDITYSNVVGGQNGVSFEDGTPNFGEGNIFADPYFADPNNNDYHLMSQAGRWDTSSQSWVKDDVMSPCIDAGDLDSDWTAELWPHGIRTNIGAYGGTLQASRSLSDAGNVADLNRDGIVDSTDICMMVDHWHTDEPYCDIAPAPFGDGIVDIQDMAILGENLFEDYRMIAHWKLDETEGNIAHDNTGNHHATLNSNPVWQPAEGKMDGALQFDGIDDYANAGFVLNPSSGPLSAYAWIKGSMPGQVIISQTDGTGFGGTWLGADQVDGKLFTNLMYFELASESVITDDQWHHVGIVWDGSRRYLYVDEEEVARDTSDMTAIQSTGDLYLGASKNLEATSFFSGLIDDVRIYNRAVSP